MRLSARECGCRQHGLSHTDFFRAHRYHRYHRFFLSPTEMKEIKEIYGALGLRARRERRERRKDIELIPRKQRKNGFKTIKMA